MATLVENDGWVQDGYIKAHEPMEGREVLYSELFFRYRPTPPMESRQHTAKIGRLIAMPNDDQTMASEWAAIDFLTTKITEWSLVNRGGHPVAVSRESLSALNPSLFRRLYNIVLGFDTSDHRPDKQGLVERIARLEGELAVVRTLYETASDSPLKTIGEQLGN